MVRYSAPTALVSVRTALLVVDDRHLGPSPVVIGACFGLERVAGGFEKTFCAISRFASLGTSDP